MAQTGRKEGDFYGCDQYDWFGGKYVAGKEKFHTGEAGLQGLRSPREKFELHRVGEEVHLGF